MSTKTKKEEALQLLDDLDSLSSVAPIQSSPTTVPPVTGQGEAADVLKFLDEITQKSSEPTRTAHLERPVSRSATPSLRKSTERIRVGTPVSQVSSSRGEGPSASVTPRVDGDLGASKAAFPSSGKGWGWGNVWSSASAALQQAKSVVDEQVKNLPNNEQAKKWTEGVTSYVNREQLEKISEPT